MENEILKLLFIIFIIAPLVAQYIIHCVTPSYTDKESEKISKKQLKILKYDKLFLKFLCVIIPIFLIIAYFCHYPLFRY